jgi:hypothetical protein
MGDIFYSSQISADTQGMSLRDWFAGQALSGFLAGDPQTEWKPTAVAACAYGMADAMIAARKGGA